MCVAVCEQSSECAHDVSYEFRGVTQQASSDVPATAQLSCQTEKCWVDPLVALNRNVAVFKRCLVVWETKSSNKPDDKKCTASLDEMFAPRKGVFQACDCGK